MTEDDVFIQTKGAYLCLMRPTMRDCMYRHELASIPSIAPQVPDDIVSALILGSGWRERIIGFALAMAKTPASFVAHVEKSLETPRGIAITPACAFLAVLARAGEFKVEPSFADDLDRSVFDGELGWAIDKMMFHAGLRPDDIAGRGPYYGQVFEDYIEIYNWFRTA